MQSRDFCFWLQGFFELRGAAPDDYMPSITGPQAKMIQDHLNLVFIHEIDPAMGDEKHQQKLNLAHSNDNKPPKNYIPDYLNPNSPGYVPGARC
jgi:hypothetical protein